MTLSIKAWEEWPRQSAAPEESRLEYRGKVKESGGVLKHDLFTSHHVRGRRRGGTAWLANARDGGETLTVTKPHDLKGCRLRGGSPPRAEPRPRQATAGGERPHRREGHVGVACLPSQRPCRW